MYSTKHITQPQQKRQNKLKIILPKPSVSDALNHTPTQNKFEL